MNPRAPIEPALAAALPDLHRWLQQRAAELRAERDGHRAQLVEPAAQTSNSFIAGSEGALADADDERELALLQHVGQALAEVEDALRRIDAGHYGTCAACGEAIALARLRARPEAALCLNCQAARERSQPR